MYYVTIPDIDIEFRSVLITVVGHTEYWDRRRSVDQWRDSYAAWSLAPFVVVLLILHGGEEKFEFYHSSPLPATIQVSSSKDPA